MKKALFLAALVLVPLAGFFAWKTLPSVRPEYVGKWQGNLHSKMTYEFFPDGTYAWRDDAASIKNDRNVRMSAKGTWRATSNRLYLTASELKAEGLTSTRQAFADLQRDTVKQTHSMPIRWKSPREWYPVEVAMGHFVKVK